MDAPPPGPRGPLGRWLPRTASGRRRARDRRLAALRRFGEEHAWSVLGLHQDLSRRYPVAPLLGARSAQAELALSGTWEQWPAAVLSVLVQGTRGPAPDRVVQVTTLDTGPAAWEFTATWRDAGPTVVLLGREDPDVVDRVAAAVREGGADLQVGDQIAADGVELVHVRELVGRGADLDLEGPLRALVATAAALP